MPKPRRVLSYQMNSIHVFADETHEVVERWLIKEFYKDGNPKDLDYCLRVLQMEIFIRIFMDITLCSYTEAESKVVKWPKSLTLS